MNIGGFDLFPVKELSARLWLERSHFSGGVNVSAIERNAVRIAESQRVYVVDHANHRIYGTPAMIAKIVAAVPQEPLPPVKDADDLIDDLYAEQRDLRRDHPRYAEFYAEMSARIEAAEEHQAKEMGEHFSRRNPMASKEELTDLFARVDAALGRAT